MARRLSPTGTCWCGCGAATKESSFFLPGHDRVAETAVVRAEYGGVPEFLDAHGYAPDSPDGLNPRDAIARMKSNAPWRYDALADYLRAQATFDVDEATLSFVQIDKMLNKRGASLPPSASAHRAWWANDRTHSHAKAWLDNGWETTRVDMASGEVTFARRTTD